MQAKEAKSISEMDDQARKVDVLVREVLGDSYVTMQTLALNLTEDFTSGRALVHAEIEQGKGGPEKTLKIEGRGVGLMDAFFDGMMHAFSSEYVSLAAITAVDFNISIKMRGTDGRKTDAFAIATLRVKNSDNDEYSFSHRTSSISRSSANVVTDVFAFFLNSERAYVQLFLALEDAKKRARPDLVERYQNQMGVLVHATSYREIVKKLSRGP